MITVIGSGSGDGESLTLKAFNTIKNAKNIILSTSKIPVADFLKSNGISFTTLDGIFEASYDFDELNQKITEALNEYDECVYVVHGNALDDTGVRGLNKEKITVIPGVSVADTCAAYLANADDFRSYTSTEVLNGVHIDLHGNVIITCIDTRLIASDIKCIISELYGDEYKVELYYESFSGKQHKAKLDICELDMQGDECYNHTASIYIAKQELKDVYKYDIYHLLEITSRLCGRNGCPWDSAQTHTSLRPYLIEEAYEVAETIDEDDIYRMYDELGDVLFQVAIHSDIAKNSGEFEFNDVTDAISRKMIRRHPQLFGNAPMQGDLNDNWEKAKKDEKQLSTVSDVMHDVPEILPSLAYAEKIQHKAEKAGIKNDSVQKNIESINEILKNVKSEEEIGKLLFTTVALARSLGVHPELALHGETLRFIKKFD